MCELPDGLTLRRLQENARKLGFMPEVSALAFREGDDPWKVSASVPVYERVEVKMSEAAKLKCALEAIEACGSTDLIKRWYRNWMPGIEPPTEAQMSMSVFLMDHCYQLLTGLKRQ